MNDCGLMFPGVYEVLITRKSDGQKRVVTHDNIKETLKPKDYDKLSNGVFMLGRYEDAKFIVTIHAQRFGGPYEGTFL